jgi:nucleoside-diphosphate-sugar epimerase
MPRIASEIAAIALAERGVRSSIVRLAPSVHGEGDTHGFVPRLIGIARDKGVSAFVGDGANRWPAVHRLDVARLFRLAVDAAPAGSRLHGAGDEGVPFATSPASSVATWTCQLSAFPAPEADAHFGWLGAIVSADNPTSSALTRQRLGWRPVQPALIQDIERGHYFDDWTTIGPAGIEAEGGLHDWLVRASVGE